jgi:hypothetical protein
MMPQRVGCGDAFEGDSSLVLESRFVCDGDQTESRLEDGSGDDSGPHEKQNNCPKQTDEGGH